MGNILIKNQISDKEIERFKSKIVQCPNGCWEIPGAKDKDGYSRFFEYVNHAHNVVRRAHRLSFFVFTGTDPSERLVLHKCDNRYCVNPEHLFLGTQKDNIHDAMRKNRKPAAPSFQGANHPRSVVTPAMAESMRYDYLYNNGTQENLSIKYGVSKGTIFYVLSGQHWTVRGQEDITRG